MTSSELLDAVRRMLDLLGPDRPGASLPRQLVDVLQAKAPTQRVVAESTGQAAAPKWASS